MCFCQFQDSQFSCLRLSTAFSVCIHSDQPISMSGHFIQAAAGGVEEVPISTALGYSLGKTLGRGAFAKVKAAWSPYSRKMVAIKIIATHSASKEILTKFLPREVAILMRLNHKNILKTHCVVETVKYCFIVQEIAHNGDLQDYLEAHGSLLEREARFWLRQLCRAISYCHKKEIAHRDLKCKNIMLDKYMHIKVGGSGKPAIVVALCKDFGIAIDMKASAVTTRCCTKTYAPPEIFDPLVTEFDGKKLDIWSLGVILYEMVCGDVPFQDNKPGTSMPPNFQAGVIYPASVTIDFIGLMEAIFNLDPKKRPSIADIRVFRWTNAPACIKPQPLKATPKYTVENCMDPSSTFSEVRPAQVPSKPAKPAPFIPAPVTLSPVLVNPAPIAATPTTPAQKRKRGQRVVEMLKNIFCFK